MVGDCNKYKDAKLRRIDFKSWQRFVFNCLNELDAIVGRDLAQLASAKAVTHRAARIEGSRQKGRKNAINSCSPACAVTVDPVKGWKMWMTVGYDNVEHERGERGGGEGGATKRALGGPSRGTSGAGGGCAQCCVWNVTIFHSVVVPFENADAADQVATKPALRLQSAWTVQT